MSSKESQTAIGLNSHNFSKNFLHLKKKVWIFVIIY